MKKIIIVFLLSILATIGYSISCRDVKINKSKKTDTALQGQGSDISKFVVEEHKIVSKDIDQPDHMEFWKKISPDILGKRKKWKEGVSYSRDENRIAEINKQLEPFRYRLVENTKPSKRNPSYHFYYNNELLLEGIGEVRCFTIDKKNEKFLFTADQPLENGPPYGKRILVINGNIKDWGYSEIGCPRLLNGSLMWVHEKVKAASGNNYIGGYSVMKDDKEIYSFYEKENPTTGTIKSFFTKSNNWILEYTNNVIINGENIKNKRNYDEVFGYQYLRDEPFYFFKKNSKIGMSYKNKVLPYQYDEVVHYQCCEPALFDIRGNENMVWFFALKDEYWYYVEAGIFE